MRVISSPDLWHPFALSHSHNCPRSYFEHPLSSHLRVHPLFQGDHHHYMAASVKARPETIRKRKITVLIFMKTPNSYFC